MFTDAQRSTTAHRKLVVRLRKLQEGCCGLRPKSEKKGKKGKAKGEDDGVVNMDEAAEKEFNTEVSRCVIRVLGVKKTEPVGDRIIRFLGAFLRSASEKGMPEMSAADCSA
jgi:condensin complex subunit 3